MSGCLLCSLTQESMLMCRDRSRSVFNAVASKSGPKRLAKMFANFIVLHVGMPDEAFFPTMPFCLRGCFCLFAFSRLVELVVGLCCFEEQFTQLKQGDKVLHLANSTLQNKTIQKLKLVGMV